ncbi:MAG: hypothetical protein ACI4ML_01545 [Aristaeellaceae bacterium]
MTWRGNRRPSEAQRQPWPEEPRWDGAGYDAPGYDEPGYDASRYDGAGYEEPAYGPEGYDEPPLAREIIATNRTVRLTCMLAAMMGLLGLFLCFAEDRSRAIRHFAGQSAALLAVHAVLALLLYALGSLLGSLPLIGLVLRGLCLVVYLAALLVIIVLRIRMMFFAYRGVRLTLPLVGEAISRRMGV